MLAFHTLRSGLETQAAPAPTRLVTTLAGRFRTALLASGVFDHVEVDTGTDPDRLVIALCAFDGAHAEEDVAHTLEDTWRELCLAHWEAHATSIEPGHVELEASTLRGATPNHVSLHAVAVRCPVVPEQRSGGASLA